MFKLSTTIKLRVLLSPTYNMNQFQVYINAALMERERESEILKIAMACITQSLPVDREWLDGASLSMFVQKLCIVINAISASESVL